MKEKKLAAVQAEIAAERAAALGLADRKLRKAIATLRSHDEGLHTRRTRAQLVDDAAEACVGYVVQRESMGLPAQEARALRAEFDVPDEVWNRMGVARAN